MSVEICFPLEITRQSLFNRVSNERHYNRGTGQANLTLEEVGSGPENKSRVNEIKRSHNEGKAGKTKEAGLAQQDKLPLVNKPVCFQRGNIYS